MNAICFNCGAEKSSAIKMCEECHELPITHQDRLTSVCLSSECLRQDNLETAAKYIQKTNRLPGFHDKVIRRAEAIVSRMPEEFQLSQSFDLDEIFEEECVLE